MLPRFPSPILWVATLFIAIFDFAYIFFTDLSLSVKSTQTLILGLSSLFALYVGGVVYQTIRPNPIISRITHSFLFFCIASYFCGLSSYLGASLALPLYDQRLSEIDQAMGFDWLDFLAFVNSHDWLANSLTFLYHTSGPQFLAVIVFLAIAKRHARLNELLGLFLVSAIVTVIVATLFPAEGAYALYKPDPSLFAHRSTEAGMWHYGDFSSLRDGTMTTLQALSLEGIVTFPSFHTAVALLIAWALRDYRWLCAVMSTISALIIVSTLTEGGHYLIDIFAGFTIVVVAVCVFHRQFDSEAQNTPINEERVKPAIA